MRSNQRAYDALREVFFERHFTGHPEGSVLVSFGQTKVLCTATMIENVPPFLQGTGKGWVTAEYGMLPRATHTRSEREACQGKQSARTQEIQRLIGRSLRSVFNLESLGPRTLKLDCDVLQADGGTRTASITGAWVAACDAVAHCIKCKILDESPIVAGLAAVSVGFFQGSPLLDLDYSEDSCCDSDVNVVMTSAGQFVEIQGTAEGAHFSRQQLDQLLDLASSGIKTLLELQKQSLSSI